MCIKLFNILKQSNWSSVNILSMLVLKRHITIMSIIISTFQKLAEQIKDRNEKMKEEMIGITMLNNLNKT